MAKRYIVLYQNRAAYHNLSGKIEGDDLMDVATRAVAAARGLSAPLLVWDNKKNRPIKPSAIKAAKSAKSAPIAERQLVAQARLNAERDLSK